MIQRIKNSLTVLATLFFMGAPLAAPVLISGTASASITDSICQGVNDTNGAGVGGGCGSGGGADAEGTVGKLAKQIINILSIVVGIVAVIMIVIGGFRYITSGGESGNVSGAKNTIIYAIVGLVVVALAQLVVHFVLNGLNQAGV